MWPFVNKKGGRPYTIKEKCLWICWYLLLAAWSLLVLVRTYQILGGRRGDIEVVTWGKSHHVWQSPFPAVTICSQMKMDPDKFDFQNVYRKGSSVNGSGLSLNQVQTLLDATVLCDQHLIIKDGTNKTRPHTVPTAFDDFIRKVSHQFDDMFFSCSWHNQIIECSQLFNEFVTDEGVCYTFNGVDLWNDKSFFSNKPNTTASHWDYSRGYEYNAEADAYPRRANVNGMKGGLNVVLVSRPERHDPICKGPIKGFKVQIHNPGEAPFFKLGYLVVPPDQEVTLAIEPETVSATEAVEELPFEKRNCLFGGERKLATFKQYNHKNCEVECFANYTLDRCGCVAYYMPRNRSVPVCGGGKKQCVINATESRNKEKVEGLFNNGFDWTCKCPLDCSADKYKREYSTSRFHWKSVMEAFRVNKSVHDGLSMSRLSIYIKENMDIDQHIIDVVPEPFDGLGALFGIAVGVSFLVLTIVLYFVSITEPAEPNEQGLNMFKKMEHHGFANVDYSQENEALAYEVP